MLKNLEDTKQAFIIFDAIDGPQTEKNFQRFIRTDAGLALTRDNSDLKDILTDRQKLRSNLDGSLAASFLQFTHDEHLDPEYLLSSAQTAGIDCLNLDAHRTAFMKSGFVVHDLLHVLTGYGRDPVGEACILAFTAEQMNLIGIGFFAKALALREKIANPERPIFKIVEEARKMARRATWIPSIDFRDKMHEPLEIIRQELKIEPAELFLKHGFAESVKIETTIKTEYSSAA